MRRRSGADRAAGTDVLAAGEPPGPARVGYTRRERLGLWALAAFGLVAINGTFLYAFFVHPEQVDAAMANPVAAAFVVEALVLVGVLAYLFERWGVSRLRWPWFVVLSLVGSLAFAIPVALLFPRRDGAIGPGESGGA